MTVPGRCNGLMEEDDDNKKRRNGLMEEDDDNDEAVFGELIEDEVEAPAHLRNSPQPPSSAMWTPFASR
ncbi:hypothetical protein CK203_009367 [Vitis vinifera]|uniref:Uncharacterized protein n=1 Tax=Vitis vinifera TaxID=29760 RepID=A0A438JS30_VITVI|nr:hypothetical protein CK203_009367 [Vitis vinifera]